MHVNGIVIAIQSSIVMIVLILKLLNVFSVSIFNIT